MNEYGYAVFAGTANGKNFPLHVVEIRNGFFAGFSVFSTAQDAKSYIQQKKENLAGLEYNPDFDFSPALVSCYTKSGNRLFSKIENRQIYIAA